MDYTISCKNSKDIIDTAAKAYQLGVLYSSKYINKQRRDDTDFLSIGNNKLVKELSSNIFPIDIESCFIYDFIRGYFDGAGSVYWSYTRNKYTLCFCGDPIFLNGLKEFLEKPQLSLYHSPFGYNLKISGKTDVFNILTLMYKNSTEDTRLDRKYKIVQKCLCLGAYTLEPTKVGCD